MRVLVTGASGFIGQHLVQNLLSRGLEVTAVSRRRQNAIQHSWFSKVDFIEVDVYEDSLDPIKAFGEHDYVIHLVWPGLPNFNQMFHIEDNLPADYKFLKKLVVGGAKRILVTGTCLEYGMQSGCLKETMDSFPTTPYGMAKHHLRLWLEQLQKEIPFELCWARLFYMYGPGQNPKSLLAHLDRAIVSGESSFDMSLGEQLRDYLPIGDMVYKLSEMLLNHELNGVVNCCSGIPISVRRLVEEYMQRQSAQLDLNLGVYPYPTYEPLAFWGDDTKYQNALERNTPLETSSFA